MKRRATEGFAHKENKQPLCFKMKTHIAGRLIPEKPPGVFLLEASHNTGKAICEVTILPNPNYFVIDCKCDLRILGTKGRFDVKKSDLLNDALIFLWTANERIDWGRIDRDSRYNFFSETDKTRAGKWITYTTISGEDKPITIRELLRNTEEYDEAFETATGQLRDMKEISGQDYTSDNVHSLAEFICLCTP